MALSEQASAIKRVMQAVIEDRHELEALESEWRDLLLFEEERLQEDTADELPLWRELLEQRLSLRRRLATHQLHNLARLQKASFSRLQRRVMTLRYVHGRPWGDILERLGLSKQYVLRVHNKALERLSEIEKKN